jgi:O-acetyl-ADP-ribose deacetylase (regulator of RNase III)
MIRYKEGDLIQLAKEGNFDVITHGCNCFCTMGAGIAPQMAKAFGCDNFQLERRGRGDINKLGCIDYEIKEIYIKKPIFGTLITDFGGQDLVVVNSYTQYRYGRNHADGDKTPVDYDAIRLCMRKINHIFKGKTIGLPMIGAGLAGGNWSVIERIIEKELNAMDIWVVKYKKA